MATDQVMKTANSAAAAADASATGRSHQRHGATPISRATAWRSRSRAACEGEGTSG